MKLFSLVFLALIVLVIPLFFVGVFVMSAYHKLVKLRNRCRIAREQIEARATSPEEIAIAREVYNESVGAYNAARQAFPTNISPPYSIFKRSSYLANGASRIIAATNSPETIGPHRSKPGAAAFAANLVRESLWPD
jgi:hypothetical protein